ncbi:ester cyclase [Croceibacterium aestuarii]|uniref:ester cyclase n=1 Tax=Croceibacterium aestuarii TaxID=3064139 RepID=UPI00272E7185|nr:ester cyclase [Croceibacterium sp. D39]
MPFRQALYDALFGKSPGEVAMAAVAAINERRWDDFRSLAADDFYYVDSEENQLDGIGAFIAAMMAMLRDAPDFRLDVQGCDTAGDTVVMTGRTLSDNRRFHTVSAWRLEIGAARIRCWQSFRANDTVQLMSYLPQNSEAKSAS